MRVTRGRAAVPLLFPEAKGTLRLEAFASVGLGGTMRADALVLFVALFSAGCASVPLASGRSGSLHDTLPRGASGPSIAQSPREERPRTQEALPPSIAGDALQRRLLRRTTQRNETTVAAPGGVAGTSAESASQVRDAVREVMEGVKDSTDDIASALSKLASRPPTSLLHRGLTGVNGVFTRNLDYGANPLPWLRAALGSTAAMVAVAEDVGDADMELGILRMTGPRLQSAMFGSMLLAAWLDFLSLADAVLRECPACSVEMLLVDMYRVQELMEPTMAALASGDPARVEDATLAMPELMGRLTREFGSIRDGARKSMENFEKTLVVMQLVDMLTLASALKMSLPRLPPGASATLGVSLVMTSGGVMAGSRLVVSAEWVEMIRRYNLSMNFTAWSGR